MKIDFGINTIMQLYDAETYQKAEHKDLLPFKCDFCGKLFERTKHNKHTLVNHKHTNVDRCNRKCESNTIIINNRYVKGKEVKCALCGKSIYKSPHQLNRSKNLFCGKSCVATFYNLAEEARGKNRCVSRLEKWIRAKLLILYPNLEFQFNDRQTIGSELDIFIPSLKLAFELNGPFHYEPIFGKFILDNCQTKDKLKFHECVKHQIDLCVIDTSKQTYFKDRTCQPFLDIIVKLINERISQ